ncbi:MAG: sigma-70 region 4 domain-containing protein [Candidatus Lambdaproteobacteria bacterium]|nr:sigma-70 region 4 domain-containing protein [Candidatus Lambdaproteobacteria bacterium]
MTLVPSVEAAIDRISGSIRIEGLPPSRLYCLYRFYDVMLQSNREAIELTSATHRAAAEAGLDTLPLVFRLAIEMLRRELAGSAYLEGWPFEKACAFLLREVGELRYADIATVLGLTPEAVRRTIADARYELIGRAGL